jgi:two-component system, chemotaxis family, protein-glutamate methylesterase/glutaminase
MSPPIRIVIVDDSPFVCRLLASFLRSDGGFEVVGTALGAAQALRLVADLRPDALTLDLEMPEVNGLEAVAAIMRDHPTPVVIISGVSGHAATMTLQALDLGAVDFVFKYIPGSHTDPVALRREILAKLRAAAKIRVVRSLAQGSHAASSQRALGGEDWRRAPAAALGASAADTVGRHAGCAVIVIGASTGGPLAVRELLSHLPAELPAAILLVQHMPPSFTGVLAAQLDRQVALRVKEADDGERLMPGCVLVAPGGHHLVLRRAARVEVRRGPEIDGHCPSIDVTMQSVAQAVGARARGVVLTGMGGDGTLGLLAIRARGGVTYAQDAASCVVDGMPQRAIERGVVDFVAPPRQIARLLVAEHTGERGRRVS